MVVAERHIYMAGAERPANPPGSPPSSSQEAPSSMYDTLQEPNPDGIIEAVYNVWVVFKKDVEPNHAKELEAQIAEAIKELGHINRVVVEFRQQIRRRKKEWPNVAHGA